MNNACRSTLILTGLVCMALPAWASSMVDDPQALLLEARAALERGEIESAESAVSAARSLLESDACWDPEGSFSDLLLPELETSIASMRAAIEDLDALPGRMEESCDAPRPSNDPEDLTPFLGWGQSLTEWLRGDIARVAESIPAGAERGALLQTESYANATSLVESEVLPELTDAVRERVAVLFEGDERVTALKTRLEALKRQLIESSLERERLEGALAVVQDRHRVFERELIGFIGHSPNDAKGSDSPGTPRLGDALGQRLRERLAVVRSLEQQTLLEKVLCLEEIERFHLANVVGVSDGSRDLSGGIEALRSTVENVPVTENDVFDPSMGWFTCCMTVCRR